MNIECKHGMDSERRMAENGVKKNREQSKIETYVMMSMTMTVVMVSVTMPVMLH
tara:strand:- start:902 stop:1063 length:162 start_codon:yes stop_codon:yes gene_type:complete